MSDPTDISRLLVPIHIDALAVGSEFPSADLFQWTNLAPDFAKLQAIYSFGSELGGSPSSSGDPFDEAYRLEPGIHLHFRLPRALRHGSQQGSEDVSFPPLPNRWLVQRVVGSGPLTYNVWLIQSDAAPEDGVPGITWPTFNEQGPVEFKRIGAYTALTESLSEEDTPANPKITAVGPGNPSFSAHYPACRSVLGFYDPMENVDAGTRVSYLVTGWYSDPSDDPLATFFANFRTNYSISPGEDLTQEQQEQQFAELQAWAKERAWEGVGTRTQTAGNPLSFNLPARLLCHGLVRGITWEGEETNYWQPSEQGASLSQPAVFPVNTDNYAKDYTLAVGNTAAEALAALLAPNDDVVQDLLTALQGDLLSQSVTAADLQVELHERRFSGVHGGTLWVIRQEPDQPGANRAAASPQPGGTNVIPAALLADLRDLNAKQQLCDQLARRVEDGRWLLYAIWYLWTNEQKQGVTDATKPRVDMLAEQIQIAQNALAMEQEAWNSAKKERDVSAHGISTELANYPKTQMAGTARLNAAGEPEYYLFGCDLGFIKELNASELSAALHGAFQTQGKPLTDQARVSVIEAGSKWTIADAGVQYLIQRDGQKLKVLLGLKYRLAASAARPFQKPNDPGIAVAGPAMARLNSWLQSDPLPCRLSGQEVTSITLEPPGGAPVTITGDVLGIDLISDWATLPVHGGIHGSLLGEALLLDEQNASAIAKCAAESDMDKLTPIVKALQNPKSTAAQADPPSAPNVLTGCLPDATAMFDWAGNPWIPLFLVWQVSWQPDYQPAAADQPLPEDLIASRWTLGENTGSTMDVDLVLTNDQIDSVDPQVYQGYTILTPSAAKSLADRLAALDESSPLVNQLKNLRVQSQMLDGFNDALLLQKPGLQLPPLDFQAWFDSGGSSYTIDSIHAAINDGFDERRDTFRTAPCVTDDPFLPIRAGRLEITQLSIVDAFGQTLKLPVDQVNRAHSCVVDASSPPQDGHIVTLRPRFAQPMRLRLDWPNASPELQQKGGPVCGWIVPNHLDKSLTVYAASGIPLGALQKKLDLQSGANGGAAGAFYWVDVPGGGNGDSDLDAPECADRLATIIENTHLRYFCCWVLGLSADHGGVFSLLVESAMAAADQRTPDEDPGLAVLVGRPLALVRADLQFETAGLPAHRPELRPEAAPGAALDDLLDTGGFQDVKWPLRLGDLHARNDGLIGVFMCDAAEDDVTTSGDFYPAWGGQNEIFAAQDFWAGCCQPLQVTMLLDLQARVHATCGVLPRTFFELPHETVTGARRAREVFFQTAPVLGLSSTPQIPKPSDDYGEWSWAYRPDVTNWQLDPTIVEATDRAGFSNTWPAIAEGWLKLAIAPLRVLSFYAREGAEVPSGTNVHLAWSLQAAESLRLEQKQANGTYAKVQEWAAQPLPREYGPVTIVAETTLRITAAAANAEPSSRELTVKIKKPSPAKTNLPTTTPNE